MEDRFRSLYKLKQELYTEDAPLIIEKGSLLQDMQTNALVIQLKFHSISQKPFKALKIRINTYDVYEENVNDKNYQNLKKYLNGKLGKFIEEKNEDNKTETVWKDGYSLSYNQKLEDIVFSARIE